MGQVKDFEQLPAWARPRSVALFVLLLLVIRYAVAAMSGLVRDEGYYTLWSFWPSSGYLDHPPMVAWLIGIGRAVLGESEAAIRLLPVLSTVVVSFAIYRTGRLLLNARTAALAVIWYNLTVAGGLQFLATPDAPVIAFWALTIWCVAEFVHSRNARWWLLAGVFGGLALLSKYTAAFLGIGLILYLLTSRERRGWLRLWQVWVGGALALLVWSPNWLWNVGNNWASVALQGRRLDDFGTGKGDVLAQFGEYLGGQVLASGLFLFIFTIIAAVLFARRKDPTARPALALLLLTSLPILLFFAGHTFRFRVEANWPIVVWPSLSLAGAWAAVHFRPRNKLAAGVLAGFRLAQAPLGVLLLGVLYAQAVWQPLPPGPADRTRDMRGWDGLYAAVHAEAEAQGAAWIGIAADYGLAGQMATYGRFAAEPRPIYPVDDFRRYGFLPPLAPDALAGTALLVAPGWFKAERIAALFAKVEQLPPVERKERSGEVLERFTLFRVSEPLPAVTGVLAQR